MKDVSCVDQLSFVRSVTNVTAVALDLPTRLENWEAPGAGLKVLRILKQGYMLPFRTHPHLIKSPTITSCYANPHRNLYLLESLHQLMNKNAVELIKNQESGVLQPTFLGPKPNNRLSPILDLSNLKQFLKAEKFKMGTLETIRTSLQQREWVTSIDFKAVYQYIKYLRFHIQGQSYQFKALPFGLSTVPMEFTVIAKEVKLIAIHGESQIPPNLFPAYAGAGRDLSGTRLDGELREIRTGPQTSLRLPVRPQMWPGPTPDQWLTFIKNSQPWQARTPACRYR